MSSRREKLERDKAKIEKNDRYYLMGFVLIIIIALVIFLLPNLNIETYSPWITIALGINGILYVNWVAKWDKLGKAIEREKEIERKSYKRKRFDDYS